MNLRNAFKRLSSFFSSQASQCADENPLHPLEFLEERDLLAAAPVGPEFRVNTTTLNDQTSPDVAVAADGSFVAVWRSEGSGTRDIFAQRYDAAGMTLGTEFRVNTYTSNSQSLPTIAMDSDGDFLISWSSYGQAVSGAYGVYAQRYNSLGNPIGGEFLVSSNPLGQSNSSIAMNAGGDFVITWLSTAGPSSYSDIYAQRYDANGTPLGSEFRVNTYTTSNQLFSTAAISEDGSFVITWQSHQEGNYDVYAQRFNAAGQSVGGEFRVNTFATHVQRFSRIAMNASGDFVIAWASLAQDGSNNGIYAQRFLASGVPIGGEFRVNTTTSESQNLWAISSNADGDFVVVWTSPQDGDGGGIIAQLFSSDGNPSGGEIVVNAYITSYQEAPAVAVAANGSFVVLWQSRGQDGSGEGIYAQRFLQGNPPIATAGGPYTVSEGNSLTLDASGSTDADGVIIDYAWDIDGDFIFADASGVSPTLTWAQLVALGIMDGSASRSIRVRITDSQGFSITSNAAELTVHNAAPVAQINAWNFMIRGQTREIWFNPVDPSPVDQAANFTYNIDWENDGIVDYTSIGPWWGVGIAHTFATSGTHTIRATITDKDGGVSDPVLFQVTVVDWALLQDPNDSSKTDLHWGGTTGIDAYAFVPGLVLKQAENNRLFGTPQITFLPSFNGKIYVYGQGGNDLVFADVVSVPLIVSGGDGDDVLIGGRAGDTIDGGNGNDIIFGGTLDTDGNDLLTGGDGNDLIIGHLGADSLHGGAGSDLLIAGKLQFSNLPTAIFSLQAEWLSGRPLATKVQNLSGIGTGPRNNGAWFLQAGSTALDDSAIDVILGEADDDWLLYDFSEDLASDLNLSMDAATNIG